MRIITGRYKGMSLFTVPGNTTRPTTDYQREVVFSIFQEYEGARALDLYAGTGSFGLECLSRGAAWADFVEFSNKALNILIKNVEKLQCSEVCHVHRRKVSAFLSSANPISEIAADIAEQHEALASQLEVNSDLVGSASFSTEQPGKNVKRAFLPWDVIFLDPPYNHNLVNATLSLIFARNLLAPDGVIIVEHSPREKVAAEFLPYVTKHKPGKITCLTVLKSNQE
jgi:16S rRNA (guanine966-N2)-methyltransferase